MWTALAGGVGGAKLARGLAALAQERQQDLRVIVNTGDDFIHHGLQIAPDLDTVLYTLAGIANSATGWGIAGDTFATMDQLASLGEETWFRLGDRDFATHIARTQRRRAGQTLTQVTHQFAAALGIPSAITLLPMTDDVVATEIATPAGWLAFQEYFVHRQHADPVHGIRFNGIERARPTAAVLEAITEAEVVIFCPSNPLVSIGPILALPGLRAALAQRQEGGARIAVSPIIGGRALRGPADRMMEGMGHEVSALGVARLYADIIDIFVIDEQDAALAPAIADLGMRPLVAATIMQTPADSLALARTILAATTR